MAGFFRQYVQVAGLLLGIESNEMREIHPVPRLLLRIKKEGIYRSSLSIVIFSLEG
jgi:hypothetical protein